MLFHNPIESIYVSNLQIMLQDKSHTGGAMVIPEIWTRKAKPGIIKYQEKISAMMDLFEDYENVHGLAEGDVTNLEIAILNETIQIAEDFLYKMKVRHVRMRLRQVKVEQNVGRELTNRSLAKIKSTAFPEILSNEVMSYLPAVYRWDSLRQKYNYEFLMKGLFKKTVRRINIIFGEFMAVVSRHVDYITEKTKSAVVPFAVHDPDWNHFTTTAVVKWCRVTLKMDMIEIILGLYRQLELAHIDSVTKKTDYNDFCQRMIKILHVLVIAIKPTKRKCR